MLIGVPAAFVLTRKRVPACTALMAFFLSPLIIHRTAGPGGIEPGRHQADDALPDHAADHQGRHGGGILFAFVRSFDELTVALFVTSGLTATLPKQMWSDAILKASPGLTAVSTVMLIFVTAAILVAEYFNRRQGSR